MNISEIRVKLVRDGTERLKAFCSVTIDGDFVIRDLKVIDGVNGLFVAMPSRKLSDRCSQCGSKNHLRARFCNECGTKLGDSRTSRDDPGRTKLHADIAHPINAACRERLQNAVVEAYEAELTKSKEPDYEPQPYGETEDVPEFGPQEVEEDAGDEPAVPVASAVHDDYDTLIADLEQGSSKRRKRHGADHGRRDAGRDTRKDSARRPDERKPEPAMAQAKAEDPLDRFLSTLGAGDESTKPPEKKEGARARHPGPRRKDKPVRETRERREPPAAPPPRPPRPEPVPVAEPQVAEPQAAEPQEEEDDFGVGIL